LSRFACSSAARVSGVMNVYPVAEAGMIAPSAGLRERRGGMASLSGHGATASASVVRSRLPRKPAAGSAPGTIHALQPYDRITYRFRRCRRSAANLVSSEKIAAPKLRPLLNMRIPMPSKIGLSAGIEIICWTAVVAPLHAGWDGIEFDGGNWPDRSHVEMQQ
jgi:hypothetical protein